VTELVSQGASWYHSLIVRADRRFANGYTVQASYVWAKMMDVGSNAIGGGQSFFLNPSDQRPERGISTYDRTHHLSITGMMELPVGRGKVLLPNAGSVLNRIVGGWQLGASYQFYTGVPIGFTTNFALSGNIRDAVRSDHPKVSSANGAAIRWFNATPFNTSVSASALQGNLRVNPIYYSFLRTGLTNDLNASLNKSIPIVEGIKATFRFEAFNVMNHPTMWGSPDTNPTSGTFGQVTGGPGMDPRMLQFGGKITF